MKQQCINTAPRPKPDFNTPRGIRNNNPLNIEYNRRNNWRGQVGSDGRFVIFENDKWGFRAAARVLRSYRKRGINNISAIIKTFAPPHENNSDHYANVVSQISGFGKYTVIDVRNDNIAAKVIQAMAKMEVGHLYPMHEVMEGVKLA
ncbi:virion protein [Photobacterium jeanii]|uniref:Virion protein n=2 Tax=Photobacterium jeanii TaxID=858640 RepID=A0A178K3R2_9GAMM|nr:virion protein [Photobacterium jeanii]PST91272.1 virion protein [Photobacterium jeanii]